MPAHILVVDGDRTVAEVLIANLRQAGYGVEWTSDGSKAFQLWQGRRPDVVIADLMLPGRSGLELVDRRRSEADRAAVIILSARMDEDRLVGLETGADDYVIKPFSPSELVQRVEALLRRTERLAETRLVNRRLRVDDLLLDLDSRTVQRGNQLLALTSREFDLLAFLVAHPGQTFSKAELMQRVWGWEFADTSTVSVHVRRVREKLDVDPSAPRIVLAVGRAGYQVSPKLAAEPPESEPRHDNRQDTGIR